MENYLIVTCNLTDAYLFPHILFQHKEALLEQPSPSTQKNSQNIYERHTIINLKKSIPDF